jgi:hypothetical protein
MTRDKNIGPVARIRGNIVNARRQFGLGAGARGMPTAVESILPNSRRQF